jgi:hypothetical protein
VTPKPFAPSKLNQAHTLLDSVFLRLNFGWWENFNIENFISLQNIYKIIILLLTLFSMFLKGGLLEANFAVKNCKNEFIANSLTSPDFTGQAKLHSWGYKEHFIGPSSCGLLAPLPFLFLFTL